MADLAKGFDGSLQIVFKHFPLGTTCNNAIAVDLHPQACEAARAAQAAQRQGRFWTFHDALFASGLGSQDAALDRVAQQSGLDLKRFAEDREDGEIAAKVESDVKLGIRLGVDATPAVFLNGRRAHDTRAEALRVLIAHEIEHPGE